MKKPPSIAPVYCYLVPHLAEVARDHGYALTVHGSMQRDLDLVAVPWIDGASGPVELASALYERIKWASSHDQPKGPVVRPHGRLAWTIALGGGAYLDLSIMPCKAPERDPEPAPG
jgi:hypothetical protein